MRVAYATAADYAALDDDLPLAVPALLSAGVAVDVLAWDGAYDWSDYDLVVVRSTWDYVGRRPEFLTWAKRVLRLANPAAVLAWNTDKVYLRSLAAAGIPIVPTRWVSPRDPAGSGQPDPSWDEWVVKPSVSAGARDTARYRTGDEEISGSHVARLVAEGRTAMVQPYLSAVDDCGETACVFLAGTLSHGVRKGPLLVHGRGPLARKDYREQLSPRQPGPDELALASAALAAVPGGPDQLLYARVDVIRAADGSPVVIEVELTEPSLFLALAPGSAERFAAAVLDRAIREHGLCTND